MRMRQPPEERDTARPARRRRRNHAAAALLLAAALLAGCTETKFFPPSPDLRAHLGPTAAVAMPGQPMLQLAKPVGGTGSAALIGAGQGASVGLGTAAVGCSGGDGYACAGGVLLGAAIAIVAAPVGAIAGAINSHSQLEVSTADASLHAAFAEARASATHRLRDRVVAAGQGLSAYRLSSYAAPAGGGPAEGAAAGGFTSALEIAVTDLDLPLDGRIDPDAALVITADARLIDARTGAELYRRTWSYLGRSRNYFREAADNARLLRADIEDGLAKLAARMVDDLFVSGAPEIQRSAGRAGTAFTVAAPTTEAAAAWQGGAQTIVPAKASGAAASPAGGAAVAATAAPLATDVPFSVELGGKSYDGVATLTHGHIAGRLLAFGRPISLAADIKDNALTARLAGALDPLNGTFGANCVADGTASPATGALAIRMLATCPVGNPKILLRLALPPQAASS